MSGFFIENRVYYENTDAGGIMFYGEYLRFFERARTEYLRSLGFSVADLTKGENPTIFVVRRVEVDYLKPIFLDDMLHITAHIIQKKHSSVLFEQNILRDNIITTTAKILCVATDLNGKPKKCDIL
jgi:acyl-CoA thioester hydrolase